MKLVMTKRTGFAFGVLAGVLNAAGGALFLTGAYWGLLFNIASIFAGIMMMILGATEKKVKIKQYTTFAAVLLLFCSMIPGIPGKIGGALAWPIFAAPYFKETESDTPIHTMSMLVMFAGAAQLIGSFIPMGSGLAGIFVIVFGIIDSVFAWVLFQNEPKA